MSGVLNGLTGKAESAHNMVEGILGELTQQTQHLSELVSAFREENQEQFFQRVRSQANSGGGGTVDVNLPVGLGHGWALISIAATGGGGSLALYQDSVDDLNLLKALTFPASNRITDVFASGEFVPSGCNLIARFFGQAAATNCAVILRLQRLEVDPARIIAG